MMTPRVVDISHHNRVMDLRATAMSGVWGVIHKASQGTGYRDPDYAARRKLARDAGLLWGAYHFNDGSDVERQVDWFIKCAQPDDSTLMVLDFEDNPKSNMSIQQAVQFLRSLERKTGRKGAIYSGNRLKENIAKLNPSDRAYVCSHRLWLCQYGPRAVLPAGFAAYWLWQYTGDGIGPQPHSVAGIAGSGIDLNAYQGGRERLASEWAPSAGMNAVEPTDAPSPAAGSAHARQAEEDHADDGLADVGGDDDAPEPQPIRETHIQLRGRYSLDVEVLQKKLIGLGYYELGDDDGKWGGKTRGSIVAFMNDRGKSPDGLMTDNGWTGARAAAIVTDEVSRAVAEHWPRPVADERANAKPKDIAPKVEAVRQSLLQRFWAKVTGGGAAGVALVSGAGSKFQWVSDSLSPVREFFYDMPGWVWFALVAAGCVIVYLSANKTVEATTADYNKGRIN